MAGVWRIDWRWRRETVVTQKPRLKATAGAQQRDNVGLGLGEAGLQWRGGVQRKGQDQGIKDDK